MDDMATGHCPDYSDALVTIITAEPERLEFNVHYDVICEDCDFDPDDHVEARDGRLIMECVDTRPEAMMTIVHWFYTKTFASCRALSESSSIKTEGSDDLESKTVPEGKRSDTPVIPENTDGTPSLAKMLTPTVPSNSQQALRPDSTLPSHIAEAEEIPSAVPGPHYEELLGIYIFATTFHFSKLQLESFKQWQRIQLAAPNTYPSTKVVIKAFSELQEGTPLLQFIAWQFARYQAASKDRTTFLTKFKGMPSAFMAELAFHISEIQTQGPALSWCQFHAHPSASAASDCIKSREDERLLSRFRKRKTCVAELDALQERLRRHKRVLQKIRTAHPRRCVVNLDVDKEGFVVGMMS